MVAQNRVWLLCATTLCCLVHIVMEFLCLCSWFWTFGHFFTLCTGTKILQGYWYNFGYKDSARLLVQFCEVTGTKLLCAPDNGTKILQGYWYNFVWLLCAADTGGYSVQLTLVLRFYLLQNILQESSLQWTFVTFVVKS